MNRSRRCVEALLCSCSKVANEISLVPQRRRRIHPTDLAKSDFVRDDHIRHDRELDGTCDHATAVMTEGSWTPMHAGSRLSPNEVPVSTSDACTRLDDQFLDVADPRVPNRGSESEDDEENEEISTGCAPCFGHCKVAAESCNDTNGSRSFCNDGVTCGNGRSGHRSDVNRIARRYNQIVPASCSSPSRREWAYCKASSLRWSICCAVPEGDVVSFSSLRA
eukprot:TRINITY_DN19236_c0_g1_i1.p1 TRINITY_DN19236_c0_g1~~TRINITY_DN19236_c0_g1_i1.p1  ORF type:complete len:241 (+),score=25.84 TRINITY_DN19236_c0_g1_i1:63-725(+)